VSTALAKTAGGFLVQPQGLGDMWKICEVLADSTLVPKDYIGKPGNVFAAIQLGGELGLSPMQALQNIAVINGRGAVWGDGQLALCMAHPDYVDTIETLDEATMTATCVAKRKGRSDKTATFSLEEAKLAKLLDKSGTPWQTYPKRMLKARARGFALRDQWTDVLKGVLSREEAQDIPAEVRAEVIERPSAAQPSPAPTLGGAGPAEESKPKQESKPVGPVFWLGWTDKTWAGKPMHDAPGPILLDYIQLIAGMLEDQTRARLHDGMRKGARAAEAFLLNSDSKSLVDYVAFCERTGFTSHDKPDDPKSIDMAQAVLDERLAAEADKAATDPIAEGMQAAHDATHKPAADGWGLEAPQ
jgi:hypothetical protein